MKPERQGQDSPVACSVWLRFWLPFPYLLMANGGNPEQRLKATRHNAMWMREHGFSYIKRWGIAFAAAHWLVALAHDVESAGLGLLFAELAYFGTFAGLIAMVFLRWRLVR